MSVMADWSILTNHGKALTCIADDPGIRLRDIASRLGITERTAFDIVADLTAVGYVTKTGTAVAIVMRFRPIFRSMKPSDAN